MTNSVTSRQSKDVTNGSRRYTIICLEGELMICLEGLQQHGFSHLSQQVIGATKYVDQDGR
jgi:hypothetical protein